MPIKPFSHDLKFDFSAFHDAMIQVMHGAQELRKTIERRAAARRAITTSYAPPIFEGTDI